MTLKRDEFLKTVHSMAVYATALVKLRDCEDEVTLNKEEAQSIVWAFQLMKEGSKDD